MAMPHERLVAIEICPSGDPYSRAWDATNIYVTPEGHRHTYYNGELSGRFRKSTLITCIRRLYPRVSIHMKHYYRKDTSA